MPTVRLPGLIDCHVHLREPGLTQKGTMRSETRAAIAGGVTTVCDMPNTKPPTVTSEALREKIAIADAIPDCDIRFHFGVVEAAHLTELQKVWHDPSLRRRVVGVKVFLDHSTGDQRAETATIAETFALCGKLNIPVTCHCEDARTNADAATANTRTDVAAHSLMRPPASEETAIRTAIALARTHGTALHIAHLSTAGGLSAVRDAKREGVSVTCEAAPHHLFLTVDDYDVLGTLGKMNPPLRTREHLEALWAGIADGTVDCIATDHAPHTLEEKRNPEPLKAPSGVPGVETMLPLLLTVASGGWPHPSSKRPDITLSIPDIRRLCFDNPNRIFALGKDPARAAFSIDTDTRWTIRGSDLHGACGWTPYEGWNVIGKISALA